MLKYPYIGVYGYFSVNRLMDLVILVLWYFFDGKCYNVTNIYCFLKPSMHPK